MDNLLILLHVDAGRPRCPPAPEGGWGRGAIGPATGGAPVVKGVVGGDIQTRPPPAPGPRAGRGAPPGPRGGFGRAALGR